MRRIKAIGLTSGGLDSTLAGLLLSGQGIDVLQVCFKTPFFGDANAKRASERTGIRLRTVDITEPHLKMLRSPKHGYGKRMNPCIDCHILMVRTAGELLEKEGARFVFTGEVLGQRPMSQNRRALEKVARESGLNGLLLRPLSARLLPSTVAEKEGWVDRSNLLAIQGRSRKPQMRLAEELNLKEYPSPAGGCLLTEEVFSRRLRDLMLHGTGKPDVREIELLKVGRHLRPDGGPKFVVGRNQSENETIESFDIPEASLACCSAVPGPTVLSSGQLDEEGVRLLADICASYSDAEAFESVPVQVRVGGKEAVVWGVSHPRTRFASYQI